MVTEEINVEQAEERRAAGAVLLDVREEDEWRAGHAPHAEHVPLGALAAAVDRFVGRTVLTMCRSGGRSAKAAEVLAAAGVEVTNVAGGMTAWAAGGLPVVRDDGSPGDVS